MNTDIILGENEVEVKGDLVMESGSVRFANSEVPMLYAFASGTKNPERSIISHSPNNQDWGVVYRDQGDKVIFQAAGHPVMTVELKAPPVSLVDAVKDATRPESFPIPSGGLKRFDGTRPIGTIGSGSKDKKDDSSAGQDVPGRVGIGTDSPQHNLHVNGSAAGTQGFKTLSDARCKENVETIDGALETVQALRGVTFDWQAEACEGMNVAAGPQVGFLAQEVAEVLPGAVEQGEDGLYVMDANAVVPILVEAVKGLQKQIEIQAEQLETLKKQFIDFLID